jgi:cell division protein FtsZ
MNDDACKVSVIALGQSGCTWIGALAGATRPRVELIAVDSDEHTLAGCHATMKLCLEVENRGLDAGFDLDVVHKAAENKSAEVHAVLNGSDMVICTTGLGGMTGTGAIPVMIQVAKDMGALSVAVVTLPFAFESVKWKQRAERVLDELKRIADTVIVIPGDLVIQGMVDTINLPTAFSRVDNAVFWTIKCITDIITEPQSCVAPKDLWPKMVMATVGVGMGKGQNCHIKALDQAMANILSDEIGLTNAGTIFMNQYIHPEQTIDEINAVMKRLQSCIPEETFLAFWGTDSERIHNPYETIVVMVVWEPNKKADTR